VVSGLARKRIVISSFDSPGNPNYNGGGAAIVDMIALRLAAQYDVTFVTAGHRGQPVTHDEVRYRYLPVGWAGPRGGQLLYHAMLPSVARCIPHDLWIENFTPPWSTSFVPVFSRAPVVALAHNLSGEQMWQRYKLPFFLVERAGLRFYRDVVVLSDTDGEQVRRSSPKTMVRLIRNGIPLPEADQRLVTAGEHVLFMGRIDIWHKGIDLLVSAYQRSGVGLPLVIAGAGTRAEERKLSALLDGVGAGLEVRRVGHVSGERKQDLIARSAFTVMPSRVEAFGIVALEAMAWGKPVVHFSLPTLDWMEGDVGIAAYDVDGLAGAMRNLADDADLRGKLGGMARAAAWQLGGDLMADRYAVLVSNLLSEQGSR
jgi:glycosyltransferase involved in cell wall biosynthesis